MQWQEIFFLWLARWKQTQSTLAIAFRDTFADPFAEGGSSFSDGQLKSMAENWIDIEDQPMIIEAELEDHIQRVEALEDAAAGPGDDDSEPEMEIDSSDDDMELPDSATAQNWIDLIKQAAPGLGVPGEAVEHLDKFSRALRKAKLERAGRDASLHSFFSAKPAAKGGQGQGLQGWWGEA